MALLSQALHLGYLLSPHSAFQGHAAHTARCPAMLRPNGSSATCIADGVFSMPTSCFHGAPPVCPKVLRHSYRVLSRRTVSRKEPRQTTHTSCRQGPPLGWPLARRLPQPTQPR